MSMLAARCLLLSRLRAAKVIFPAGGLASSQFLSWDTYTAIRQHRQLEGFLPHQVELASSGYWSMPIEGSYPLPTVPHLDPLSPFRSIPLPVHSSAPDLRDGSRLRLRSPTYYPVALGLPLFRQRARLILGAASVLHPHHAAEDFRLLRHPGRHQALKLSLISLVQTSRRVIDRAMRPGWASLPLR